MPVTRHLIERGDGAAVELFSKRVQPIVRPPEQYCLSMAIRVVFFSGRKSLSIWSATSVFVSP
ncbi:hypothetical protein M2310_007201 [Rhizobium leguminosarum]|uniref:Uncharacterized protein n=1 Tax=Rhizobium esperanzae TaxID=1967781 RepID=A0A7W6Y1E2_9HYPH|nr:hypothetical protein [Rhizobium esperanzae]MDH6206504.1 hypothetical protein [Rhizobium leguminosarum]